MWRKGLHFVAIQFRVGRQSPKVYAELTLKKVLFFQQIIIVQDGKSKGSD